MHLPPNAFTFMQVGEDEDWRILYEKENEPDAQMLEVPNLTPFTYYRWAPAVAPHPRILSLSSQPVNAHLQYL